jgi:hypothetical protein
MSEENELICIDEEESEDIEVMKLIGPCRRWLRALSEFT